MPSESTRCLVVALAALAALASCGKTQVDDAEATASGRAGETPVDTSTGGTAGTLAAGGAPATGGTSFEAEPGECLAASVSFSGYLPSTSLFLIPKSASLREPIDDSSERTRFEAIHDALLEPANGVFSALQTERVGLSLFTSPATDGRDPSGTECPLWISRVAPDVANYPKLLAGFRSGELPTDFAGGAPLAEAIASAVAELSILEIPRLRPGLLVLVSDGEVSSCDPDMDADAAGQATAEAVSKASASGISTFVVRAGGTKRELLHRLANVGQGFDVDDAEARYYDISALEDLKQIFDSVILGVRACTLDLNGSVEPDAGPSGRVLIDGEPVPYSDSDGWHLSSPSQIELVGSACDRLVGEYPRSVIVTFPCDVLDPL